MNQTLLVFIIITPLFLLLLARRSKNISKKISSIPSPPKFPFIGNLHQLGPTPHRSLYKLSKEYGPMMLLHLGTVPTLVISSPKLAEEIIKNYDILFASRPRSKLTDMLSYNQSDIAFSQYGEVWRQMKRLGTTHLLSASRVKSLSFVRTEEVSLLLAKVADAVLKGDSVVCLTEMLNSYVTNVVTRVVLGPWVDEEKQKFLYKLTHESTDLFFNLAVGDYFPYLKWFDVVSGLDRRFKSHGKKWDAFFEDIFKFQSSKSKEANGEEGFYFLDVMLELQKDSRLGFDLTTENIKGLTMDMLIAGIDATIAGLDWCMTELIRNPDSMKKLKEEATKTANGQDFITEEQLGEMTNLKLVVKEVFRLHPPSPLLVPRESFEDCQIFGHNIPKKTRLVINAWGFGRDESNWEEPEKFKPERFLEKNVEYNGKEFFFIPFGVGRRICPGMNFSTAVIEIALANLLHRFDWRLPSGITVEDMDMNESGGIIASRNHKLELVPTVCKVN